MYEDISEVIFDEPDVIKHGTHDQSRHNPHKRGGGGDGMPYKWNPTYPTSSVFESNPAYAIEFFESVADSPISTRVSGKELDKITEQGRFKSLNEIPTKTYYPSPKYRNDRSELEHDKWGVPKDGPQPIYGYLDSKDTDYTNTVYNYGDIQITLKESVASRTTITAGDSLGDLIPVELSELQSKTTNSLHIAAATDFSTQSKLYYRDSKPTFPYWEAQIHGGVSLKDFKSVSLVPSSKVKPSTITTLKSLGIEVTTRNDNRNYR